MSNKNKSNSLSQRKIYLTVILFTYAILALIFGFAYRFAINPDGISQLRLAGYIAEGNFQQSITYSWSPLFIWMMSPFLFFGVDGLTSARIVIALSGAGLLLGSWLLSLRFGLSENLRFISVLIAALLISDWSIRNIGADLPVAALIIYYLYLITDQDILNDRKVSFFCGIIGGFSYLAHHYALPFFLAHFPVLLLLRGYIDRDKNRFYLKRVFISLLVGIFGFLMIASIWIGITSVKYGHLKVSNKGNITYAVVGPKDTDRRHPFFVGGLYKPKDDYAIHVFEDPSEVEFKSWSPFESREYFFHQLKLIKDNFDYLLSHFVTKSPFFTYAFVIGIFTLIPIAIVLNQQNKGKAFLYSWFILTSSIYCSGFLLITARSPRRFYAIMVLFLFITFHFAEELKNGFKDYLVGRRGKILTYYLLMIIVLAFALKPGVHLLKSVKNIVALEQVNPYKEIAEQINAVQFPPPYAIIRSSQKPHTDTYITYYLEKQLLGRPLSRDADGITEELRTAGAKSLLVFDNLDIVEMLKSDNRYVHVSSKGLENEERYSHLVNINIRDHEIMTGWDDEVNIFTLK
jgi:hypothetical protein